MRRSRTSSSGSSLPPLDEDVTPMEEEDGNELLGSQSRRWLADLLSGDLAAPAADGVTLGRDGLFVDYQFPVGELEMQAGLKWKRPKVRRAKKQRGECGKLTLIHI